MKKFLLILASISVVVALSACDDNKPTNNSQETTSSVASTTSNETKVEEKIDPLKEDYPRADVQIQIAVRRYLEEAYGKDIDDIKLNVDKIYSSEEEKEIPALKEKNLKPNEVAFEVSYQLHPTESGDINAMTAASGVFDEPSGCITEKYNNGILRPSGDSYVVTEWGTGF